MHNNMKLNEKKPSAVSFYDQVKSVYSVGSKYPMLTLYVTYIFQFIFNLLSS